MNLLSKIQTSAASDAVKDNAAKYVEVIEKYAPCEPDFVWSSDTEIILEWYVGERHIMHGGVHFNNYGLVPKLDYGGFGKWKCENNPTESDFQQAFSWLKGEK